MDVSKNKGTPKWMVYNGKPENPIKIDDLGGFPIFLETPTYLDPYRHAAGGVDSNNKNPSAFQRSDWCTRRVPPGVGARRMETSRCCISLDTGMSMVLSKWIINPI